MSDTSVTSVLSRVLGGHRRLFAGIAAGLAVLLVLPHGWTPQTRGLFAWDVGSAAFLLLAASMALRADPGRMPEYAEAQQEGEWTLFWLTVLGAAVSLSAVLEMFGHISKDLPAAVRTGRVSLVIATLALTWLLSQTMFALRYAHEYYQAAPGGGVDRGLDFPGETQPDYWDFVYFSAVLGMTFQVSDVQITARKLRRLATLQGLLGFITNTVILALTVNVAAGLL